MFRIEIFGYKSSNPDNKISIGNQNKLEINDILINKDADYEFYVSKNKINNYLKNIIDTIDIEITNNLTDDDLFEMISSSASFVTFKSFESKKEEKVVLSTEDKNNDDNMYNKIVSEFYKLILNQSLFESFISMFIPCLIDESYDKNKK